MKTQTQLVLATLLLSTVAGCNGRSHGGAAVGAANAAPNVTILNLTLNSAVQIGQTVEIQYLDNDSDSNAFTDVYIFPATGAKKYTKIADDLTEQNGLQQSFMWNTTGYKAGDWRIEIRCTDGKRTSKAVSAGIVELKPADPVPATDTGFVSVIETAIGNVDGMTVIPGTPDGTSLIYGRYGSDATFNSGTADAFTLPAPFGSLTGTSDGGLQSLFLCAFTTRFTWAKAILGADSSFVSAVRLGNDRVVVLLGTTGEPITFSQGAPDEFIYPNQAGGQVYATYSTSGTFLGVNNLITISPADKFFTNSIQSAKDGSVFIIGGLASEVTVAPGTPGETVLHASDNLWGYAVLKVTPAGNLAYAVLARVTVPSHSINIDSVRSTSDGGMVMSGDILGTVQFGVGNPGEPTISTSLLDPEPLDLYHIRFNASGQFVWKHIIGGPNAEPEYSAVDVANDDSVLMALDPRRGEGPTDVTFHVGDAGQTTFVVNPQSGVLARTVYAKLSPSGQLLWASGFEIEINEWRNFTATPSGGCVTVVNYPEPAMYFIGSSLSPVFNNSVETLGLLGIDPSGALSFDVTDGGINPQDQVPNFVFGTSMAQLSQTALIIAGAYFQNATFGASSQTPVALPQISGTAGFVATFGLDGLFK